MIPTPVAKADLHCHSTASEHSRLGVQRALGLPECATPPEEVYELAKRRGMDFVTITDHDTIAGVLELADRPDVFVSEELTAWFRGEPQAVHVLCWGIAPDDHDWLQAHAGDVEAVRRVPARQLDRLRAGASLLRGRRAAHRAPPPAPRAAVPGVGDPQRRAGARAQHARRHLHRDPRRRRRRRVRRPRRSRHRADLDRDAARVDSGRVSTAHPARRRYGPRRAGQRREVGPRGDGAHRPRARARRSGDDPGAERRAVDRRARDEPGRRPLRAARRRPGARPRARAAARLARLARARGVRARAARLDAGRGFATPISAAEPGARTSAGCARRCRWSLAPPSRETATWRPRARCSHACVPAIPYAPAAAFLGREKSKLITRETEPHRVALVADGVGGMHGVTHTLDELRDRGVPGFEVEVIGTDPNVDRRLPAVAEAEIPFYAGLRVGVPSLHAVVEALAEGRYDIVHLCSPGPAGVAAALIARTMELPLVGSYHTELGVYAGLRSGDRRLRAGMDTALAALYGLCEVVLSPSESADDSLRALGDTGERVERWDRGVDLGRFDPALRDAGLAARRADGALRGAADAGEGRRPARLGLRSRPGDGPAPAPCAGGRRARGGGAAGAAGRARHLPGLARGDGAGADLRQRRRVPVREPDRHVRPGDPGGAGEWPPGGCGRRGRPALPHRGWPQRAPVPRGPRGAGHGRHRTGGVAGPAGAPSEAARRGAAHARGSAHSSAWPRATAG